MPPFPTPTPETAPPLENSLVNKTVVAARHILHLGENTTVKGDSIQTTLPLVTSRAVWSNGFNVLPGSTSSYILTSDNLTITNAGNLTKVGAITSTGNSTFSGSVTAGSLSTTGSLSANSVTATDGFTTSAGNFSTTTGKVSTKELQVAGTKFSVDSLTGALTSTGVVSIANADNTFQINSSSGNIKTQGNIQAGGTITSAGAISTTGAASITAAGALNGASLNISGTAFKVDNFGAVTASKYSIDKDGNLSHDGTLTTKSSVSLANGDFLVDVNGNVSKAGTISSKAISVTGSLTTTEGITVGSSAILLSNNGTSSFVNSVNMGAAPASGSTYPIMFNAADGSAAFASNKAAIGADGSMSLLNGATLVNSDGVKLGVNATNTANKIELNSSSGNATFAGQASFLGGAATLTNAGLTMLGGDVTAKNMTASGLLNVGGKATLSSGLTVTGDTTFNGAVTLSNTLAVTSATTLSSTLAVTGAATLSNTLAVAGATTLSSTLAVTGAATLSSTLAVSGDLSVNTDKFKVTASSGNLISKGSLTMDGFANFANNQIQLNSDGSLYAQNFLKTDFEAYGKNDIVDDKTITEPLTKGSQLYIQKFNSTTNKYLTTQEYVDNAIFKQTARLNLITKDVDTQLATFQNIGKVLAAMEGPDGINPLTAVNGLVDEVQDVKVSISDLIGNGYNTVLVNCVPSVWGDGAAPEPIPTPISNLYKEDGWFYANMSSDSKINWYIPVYSGMKIKDITNLFMNNFLLSTMKLPKITVFTARKNNSTDAISGVYNAKIEYCFSDAQPTAVTAQRSCFYLIDPPKNVYSDKSHDIKCGFSITSNGSSAPVQTTFTPSTTFSTSFAASKVTGEDSILTLAVETSESNIKDYMLILQSFNISTRNGTTQMLFQNSSVVNDYLFKYFFRQHPDFSDISLYSNNLVNAGNYDAYVAGVLDNTIYSSSAVTNISPLSHVTGFKILSIGGTQVVSENQIINFPADTPSALLVCDLENNNNSLVITRNGAIITPHNTVGDHTATTPLTTGDNTFIVTEKDTANDHTKATTFNVKVLSNDTKLSSVTMNGESIALVSGAIPASTIKNVPAGTTSVNVVANAQSSSASVLVTGATGLVTGNNTVTVKVTAGDGTTIANNSFVVRVLSDDTSLSTLTVNGTAVANGSIVELSPITTAVSVVAVAAGASSGATRTISGSSGLILGNNTLTVVVTAESGATRTYTVTLKVLDGNTNLGSLLINGVSKNMNEPLFTFASTTTYVNVTATPESSSATVAVTGIPTGADPVVPGTTYNLTIKVTAQNNVSQDYNYNIRVQSNDNSIDNIFVNSQTIHFNSSNIADITLVDNPAPSTLILQVNEVSAATLEYKVENDGLEQSITSGVSKTVSIQQNNDSQIFVTINPEDNAVSSKTYTINVKSRSNDASLYGVTITPLDGTTSSVNNGQTITLPSGVNEVTVDVTAGHSGATVVVDGVSGTGYSSKTISIPAGTSTVVNISVTARDGVTQNSYSVTIVAPSDDAPSDDAPSDDTLTTFLAASNLTLFNNDSAIVTNPSDSMQKVAICFTNQTQTLKDNITNTHYTGFSIVLVGTTDNGSSWSIRKYSTDQENVTMYTLNNYNSIISNTNTHANFLAATRNASIIRDYHDSSKMVVQLSYMGGFTGSRHFLVDLYHAPNVFYRISKSNNASSQFKNYSTAVTSPNVNTTFNAFSFSKITYLKHITVGTNSFPLYVASAYDVTDNSRTVVFVFVPSVAGSDKGMLIHFFANNSNVFSDIGSLTKIGSDLNFNFTQSVNSVVKNYTSTISLQNIEETFQLKVNTITYDVMLEPSIAEVLET